MSAPLLLLALAAALAEGPSAPPAPPPDAAPSTAPAAVEGACAAPLSAYIEEVQKAGNRVAYLCLATRDDAGAALLQAIDALPADAVGDERLQRALAVHLLPRLDRALTVPEVRALGAADRRLLADGVYARRGRRSPSPEHELVFGQFDWYSPTPSFNNGSLQPVDRENIKALDDPPRPPKPPKEGGAADAIAADGTAGGAPTPCSCTTGGAAGLAWLGPLLLLLGLRRR